MKNHITFLAAALSVTAIFAADVPTVDPQTLMAPGLVRQNNFEHGIPDFHPDEKYSTAKRVWQGCPTILVTCKGKLFAGWYSGGPGEGLLNYHLIVSSSDGGVTWDKEPLMVMDSLTERQVQTLDSEFWLDPQGRFWFFWTQLDFKYKHRDPRHASVWAMVCDDPDAKMLKWSEPRFISPGFLRCQPTVLRDGRWMLCAYEWIDNHYRYSESSDQGKTWYRRVGGVKYPTPYDETSILERKDGSLWMLARTYPQEDFLAESVSTDGGKTWSDGKLTDIPDPSSRFYLGRLKSGRVLLVSNLDPDDRYKLTAQLSEDDGKTWKYKFLLDERRCSYPDAVQAKDGTIYIIYDYSRGDAKEILLTRITEKDIMLGRTRNGNLRDWNGFVSHIVNKAPLPAKLTKEEKALFKKYKR